MEPLVELGEGIQGGHERRALPWSPARAPDDLRGPPHAPLFRRAAHQALRRRPDLLEARKTSVTPARTRSTMCWGRPSSRSAWASTGSSRRRGRVSTALPPRRRPPSSASSARSTWGAWTSRRQALNVFRMKLLGATVVPVESGSKTLKDAVNEALRDWRHQRNGRPTIFWAPPWARILIP